MKIVSGKRLSQILERRGWVRIKTKSGHRKYRHADGRTVIVPYHGNAPLKKGLQAAIVRQAGLTDADL